MKKYRVRKGSIAYHAINTGKALAALGFLAFFVFAMGMCEIPNYVMPY